LKAIYDNHDLKILGADHSTYVGFNCEGAKAIEALALAEGQRRERERIVAIIKIMEIPAMYPAWCWDKETLSELKSRISQSGKE
jgi:hypothetical protein